MPRKLKFKPVITRIKLNPEQAVLACECFALDHRVTTGAYWSNGGTAQFCQGKTNPAIKVCASGGYDHGEGIHTAWATSTSSS